MDPRICSTARASTIARRVLIVDDHVDSADIMAEVLGAHGHETTVAYDPFAAMLVAAEFRPEVAILDVGLPGMDGYDLGAALRANLAHCRFLTLTGGATELNRLRSQWAGFDGHLTKPVGLDQLLAAVAGSISGKDSWRSGSFLRATPSPRAQDQQYRPKRERTQIDLYESPEVVRYWTTELRCTEAQLRAAVGEVGVNAANVRARLAK